MNRFKKKKQQQLEAEAQTKALAPSNPDHEDYLSGDFDGQPPTTSTTTSKRAAELPPEAMSKKAKAANAAEKLQEGMNTPLPQDNVGLRMLKLMGYKEGQGIGKSADGIREPLAVVKKTDRGGLGQAERQDEARRRREEWAQARVELLEQRKEDFKAAMSNRFAERRAASNLVKAMKTIETLDTRAGRERSCLWWSTARMENEEVGKEGQDEGRVEELSEPLLLVGAEVPTEAAAATQHGQMVQREEEGERKEEDEQPINDAERELWQTLGDAEKLSVATAYLREEHYYCLYCGHQYGDAEELKGDCPGESEEDH